MIEIDEYRAPPNRTYRVGMQAMLDAGNEIVRRGGDRPNFREACGLALVELTWRWRDTYAPLENAARLKQYRKAKEASR